MLHVELNPAEPALVPYDLGFCFLARKQQLKLDFDAGGPPLMAQLIGALIASGFDTEDEIIDQISDITGPHCEAGVANTLMEGENVRWLKCANGHFKVITPA